LRPHWIRYDLEAYFCKRIPLSLFLAQYFILRLWLEFRG
jgi:hypothetical protein